jgi:tripartite ATP-independent transporter DctP family solute receptor
MITLGSRRRCALLIPLLLAGCGTAEGVTVIKLAHGLPPSHPVHSGMADMAERVAAKSGGTMRIDLYHSQQLCTERECMELLQIGSLGMTKASASIMENFAPSFQVLNLPYLFLDEDHRFRVLEGEIGERLLRDGEPKRLRGLAFYDAGSRSFYTKTRPIHEPADLRGLKIRVQESPTSMRMVSALGGSPTPISWGELYTALQQGVVDGAENNPPSYHTSRHYEVAPFYSLDEHTASPDVLLVSTVIWNTLTPQEQRWLEEAARESVEVQKRLWREATEEALRAVEAAGVTIIRPDKRRFAEQVNAMLESYRTDPLIYPLIEEIRAMETPAETPLPTRHL